MEVGRRLATRQRVSGSSTTLSAQFQHALGSLHGPVRRTCHPRLACSFSSTPGPLQRQSSGGRAALVRSVPPHASSSAAAGGGNNNSSRALLPASSVAPQQLTLDDVLARCRAAVGEGLAGIRGGEAIVHGTGHHLGSQVAWSLRFRRDGAFYEEIRSKYLTFKWGFDGSADSTCWEVDPAGVAKHLEYDDHEVWGDGLLFGWGRGG